MLWLLVLHSGLYYVWPLPVCLACSDLVMLGNIKGESKKMSWLWQTAAYRTERSYFFNYFKFLLLSEIKAVISGTISNLQTYILPNLHRKPSIYQPFILPNLHFANPSNYQISNLQTYISPNLHWKTFKLPTLQFTKPTFCSNTQNL